MALTLEKLKTLPVDERASLAQALWDSILEEQTELSLPEEHKAELERRLANPNPKLIPWDEAKTKLRNR